MARSPAMTLPLPHYPLAHGVTTLDTEFLRPGLVGSHLLVEGDRAALIDVGVAKTAPRLLATLDALAIPREAVDYVIVTHVHMDHGAAAGSLLQALPNARVVVHPQGARHLVDPSKLLAGSNAVYGEAVVRERFGTMLPCPPARIIEAPDDTVLELAGRPLRFVDTPGHARHHFCVVDETSQGIFTGDTFGLSYRELDSPQGPFIFPTTTPVQFDLAAAHASLDRLLAFQPHCLYLTHFGQVREVERLAITLHRQLDDMVALAKTCPGEGQQRHHHLVKALTNYLLAQIAAHGSPLTGQPLVDLIAMDMELNSQGLAIWLNRANASKG